MSIHRQPTPTNLNQPNYLWSLESSSDLSHLWPGIFHISLPTHKIHNRESGRKEEQNHGLGSAPSARGRKFGDTFVQLSVHFAGYRGRVFARTPPPKCSLLPTDLWDLPSFVLRVSWEISRTSPLCGFRAKTDWHSHPPTQWMSSIVLQYHIYPTPPLGQDMTRGQFLNGV